jgi:hypothetical protein
MTPLEHLMRDATTALEQFFRLLCVDRDNISVAPSLSQAGTDVLLDLVVTTSPRDEETLRNAGADNALAALAQVIGAQSGLAIVSIEIA